MASINTPLEVLRVQIATNNAHSPVGAEVMSTQMGRFGQTQESVQVTPSKSDITDALEELGMSVATRANKNDLDKMKVRRGAGSNLEALGRIADYYDKLPSMPADEKRRNLILQVKQFETAMRLAYAERDGNRGDLPTADDLRKLLASFDGDPTHQFVMLEDIRQRAAMEGAPAPFLALLDEVRRDFREPARAREVLAGFASAEESVALRNEIGTHPEEYRDTYRTLLRENPRLGKVFDEMRKFSLTENFDKVIGSFLKVAGDDMASFGPSIDPIILGDVVRELTNLKNLRSVLHASNGEIAKIDRMYPREPGSTRPSGEELASRLLNFASGQVASISEAEALLVGFDPSRPETGVAAINALRDLHASLPDIIFASPQSREQQSRVLLALSDRLVALDEATYG